MKKDARQHTFTDWRENDQRRSFSFGPLTPASPLVKMKEESYPETKTVHHEGKGPVNQRSDPRGVTTINDRSFQDVCWTA